MSKWLLACPFPAPAPSLPSVLRMQAFFILQDPWANAYNFKWCDLRCCFAATIHLT